MPSASRLYLTENSAMLFGTSESSSLYIEGLSTTQRLYATNSPVPKSTSGCHFLAEKSIYLFKSLIAERRVSEQSEANDRVLFEILLGV